VATGTEGGAATQVLRRSNPIIYCELEGMPLLLKYFWCRHNTASYAVLPTTVSVGRSAAYFASCARCCTLRCALCLTRDSVGAETSVTIEVCYFRHATEMWACEESCALADYLYRLGTELCTAHSDNSRH
jgi:hypothetical protein